MSSPLTHTPNLLYGSQCHKGAWILALSLIEFGLESSQAELLILTASPLDVEFQISVLRQTSELYTPVRLFCCPLPQQLRPTKQRLACLCYYLIFDPIRLTISRRCKDDTKQPFAVRSLGDVCGQYPLVESIMSVNEVF